MTDPTPPEPGIADTSARSAAGSRPQHPVERPLTERTPRRRAWAEIAIVLSLSLGASAVYSLVSIANRLTREESLSAQTATLNPALSERPIFDLIYQLLGIAFDLAPVALVFFLLWQPGLSPFRRIGFDLTQRRRDLGVGLTLVLVIGVPGIVLFAVGRALDLNVGIDASGLLDYWWTPVVLALSALRAALTEELIVVGYLFTRLRQLGWGPWAIILSCALLRGTYHLYQGFGAFVGNVAMGIVFGWVYARWGRTAPLVVAHFVIDLIAFLGYPLAVVWFPGVFIG